jgi:hypothetical protein
VSFTGRITVILGAGLAFLGSLALPTHSRGGLVLIGFGLGMCAAVVIVYVDARQRSRWVR